MFYVPDQSFFKKEKSYLKFMSLYEEPQKNILEKHDDSLNLRKKRIRTLEPRTETSQKSSRPLKLKKFGAALPKILQKRFFLKGTVTGQTENKTLGCKKLSPQKKSLNIDRNIKRPRALLREEFRIEPWAEGGNLQL